MYMYHRQENECYPKVVYAPISKEYSILAEANLRAHNNISQNFYCSHISLFLYSVLQLNALFLTISGTFGRNIYFTGDHIYIYIYIYIYISYSGFKKTFSRY